MKAAEFLLEQKLDDGSKLLAIVGDYWIWQVPVASYMKAYAVRKNETYDPAVLPPSGSDVVWYVSEQQDYQKRPLLPSGMDDQHWKSYSTFYLFLGKDGSTLVPLSGGRWIKPAVLRKLAALTGTTQAPGLEADRAENHVLYQGKVQKIRDVAKQYTHSSLSDGSVVSAIPRNLLWTVGNSWELPGKWDTMWRINHPTAGGVWMKVDSNKLTEVGHMPPNKIFHLVRSIRELANREGWKIDVSLPEPPETKKKVVKPGGVMHKMLAYLAENPGANRSDWFVKHLGNSPQGMPGWTDSKAHDGIAASMGWIENQGTGTGYSLHITMLGNLMLGRLNAGMPAPYTDPV